MYRRVALLTRCLALFCNALSNSDPASFSKSVSLRSALDFTARGIGADSATGEGEVLVSDEAWELVVNRVRLAPGAVSSVESF